ncbi:MAG: hypothetical protein WBA16_07575 [Nonlabens sp.]
MIENTIYRFATVRPPQLPDKGGIETDVQFISPSGLNLVTLKNIEDWSYEPYLSSIKDIRTEHNDLYDFALWVKNNRTSVELSEIKGKTASMETLGSEIQTRLFNDLIFYVYKKTDLRLATAVSNLLFANHIIKIVNSETSFNLEKLLYAIVQLPEDFKVGFKPQEGNTSNLPTLSMDAKVIAESKVEFLDQVLKDMDLVEQHLLIKSTITSRQNQDNAQEAYNEALKNANYVQPVYDTETGKVVKSGYYENLTIPEYQVVDVDLLTVLNTAADFIDKETATYLKDVITTFSDYTFNDVRNYVSQSQRDLVHKVADSTQSRSTGTIAYRGVVLPFSSGQSTVTAVRLCTPSLRVFSRRQITISISGLGTHVDLARVTGMITYSDNIEVALEDELRVYSNGTPHVMRFKTFSRIDIKRVRGQLNFTDGSRLEFDGTINLGKEAPEACYSLEFNYQDNGVDDSSGEGSGPGDVTTPSIPSERFGMLRLGIMDYRKVIQTVCCYVPGELSHIENIMAREFKSKTTTRKRTVDTFDARIVENESETLQENVSTTRNEIATEVANIIAEDRNRAASAGVSVTYNEPPVTVQTTANGSIASSSSSESSNQQAITHAQEITERAQERIVTRVTTERTRRVIEEYTQTDEHGFDNRKGDAHVSGVYRWVDKIYKNQLLNYGKRLIYEFMIPEPASFHNKAVQALAQNDGTLLMHEPQDPRESANLKLGDARSASEASIYYWAKIYGVEVDLKPLQEMSMGVSEAFDIPYGQADTELDEAASVSGKFEVPEGYVATSFRAQVVFSAEGAASASLMVGDTRDDIAGRTPVHMDLPVAGARNSYISIDAGTQVPYAMFAVGRHAGSLTITFKLRLTQEFLTTWRSKAITAILAAYEEKLRLYHDQLKAVQLEEDQQLNLNPMFYRDMEQSILRKHCIAYMLRNQVYAQDHIATGLPVQSQGLESYASLVKFMELAFEWNIMSYELYPWYWAAQSRQDSKYAHMEADSTFRAFIRSGMARVLVTVRPGYEEAVAFFMSTGLPWNGTDPLGVEGTEFQAIINDVRTPTVEPQDTWTTRVPTTLTVIQASSLGLDVTGLPCNSDCGETLFDTDAGGDGYSSPWQDNKAQIGGSTAS